MSTSVDQRMKGQQGGGPAVSNGPKDTLNDEEFDSWRNQPHQSYNTSVSASSMAAAAAAAADPYMSSYYGMSFPYQNVGLGDGGAWSNGSEAMTFLGGYGGQMGSEQHSHYMDSMLGGGGGGFGGFSQPSFNYFHGNGDYSAWGTSNVGRKPNNHGPYDDYYRDVYGVGGGGDQASERAVAAAAAAAMKPVEQGMQGLGISEKVDSKGMVDCKGIPVDFVKDGGMILGGGGGGQGSGGGGGGGICGNSQAPKKMSWASIASQPAKPQPRMKPKSIPPAPMLPGKHNMDIGTWESKNGGGGGGVGGGGSGGGNSSGGGGGGGGSGGGGMKQNVVGIAASRSGAWSSPRGRGSGTGTYGGGANAPMAQVTGHQNPGGQIGYPPHPVLDKLRQSNEYNPKDFDVNTKNARFFIIKSYSEDDIHRSIKYGIWCSTEHGNKRLDTAFRDQESKGPIYLLFSVNGSGHFCGMAQMLSELDYNATSSVWAQDKWKGEFKLKWIYVKDVPNNQLRHIRLENNENKPVTNSRDTQEVPLEKGKQVMKIIHTYRHLTSIFDDFVHYEKRQEEEDQRKQVHQHPAASAAPERSGQNRQETKQL